MPFDRRALQPLTLAIVTVIASQQAQAAANSAWNCRSDNGQWECSGKTNISVEAHQAPPSDNAPIKQSPVGTITPRFNDLALEPLNSEVKPASEKTPSREQVSVESHKVPKKVEQSQIAQTNQTASTLADRGHSEAQAQTPASDTIETTEVVEEVAELAAQTDTQASAEQKLDQLDPTDRLRAEVERIQKQMPTSEFAHLDWYPFPEGQSTGSCKGRYVPPASSTGPLDQDINFEQIFVSADESLSTLGGDTELRGSVDLVQGNRSLQSAVARYNQTTGDLFLEGGVTFRQPGLLLTGKSAKSNTEDLTTTLFESQYVMHQVGARGKADELTRYGDERIEIREGSYTLCPPNDSTWAISSENIELNPETGFGKAQNAALEVFGTPILYLPLFYFPIDDRRHSGFLYPQISYGSEDGLDIALPYYFNIAPNIDDTLTPRIIANRGLLIENEARYLNEFGSYTLSTAVLPNDKIDNNDRWLFGFEHTGREGNWRTNIDYTRISDNDYFSDLGTKLDVNRAENSHISQSGSVSYIAPTWQANLAVQSYQTIDTSLTPYRRLPELTLTGQPHLSGDLFANYRATYTRFDRDIDGLTGANRITGDRLHIKPEIGTEFRTTWGYVRPVAKLWHSQYQLKNQINGFEDNPSATAGILEVDSGLYFDRSFEFNDSSYEQTLEPRVYALMVQEEDQLMLPDFDTSELTFSYESLFRDNRFSGDDRIGDTQQLSLGVTSRLFDPEGREVLSASIGQAYYFDDRTVRLNSTSPALTESHSDIATRVQWRPSKRVRMTLDSAFSANDLSNTEMTLDLSYQEDPNRVFGLRHRFTEGTRKQTTASVLWPITPVWSGLAMVQYDWLTEENVDAALGLEYESCCWKVRFIARDYLDTGEEKKQEVALQFVFKGLGGVGSAPSKVLKEKITGYEERESTLR